MSMELQKSIESLSLTEMDELLKKIEMLKVSAESKIVDVSELNTTPERTSRGTKNR